MCLSYNVLMHRGYGLEVFWSETVCCIGWKYGLGFCMTDLRVNSEIHHFILCEENLHSIKGRDNKYNMYTSDMRYNEHGYSIKI